MKKIKGLLDHIFIDGLSGMAQGLFATLIIGTIIQQIGTLIGGPRGDMIFAVGKVAAALTGAGIGVGVAAKFKESYLVVVSAATAGRSICQQAAGRYGSCGWNDGICRTGRTTWCVFGCLYWN